MVSLAAGTTVVRVGAALGRRHEPTAIIVTEEGRHAGITFYVTRRIERLPAGTSYPTVADRLIAIVETLDTWATVPDPDERAFRTETWVDATGAGLPVIDLLHERGVRARAALITETDTFAEADDGLVRIGKSYMVGRLQVLLQARRLHLPHTDETPVLVQALQDYQLDGAPARSGDPRAMHDDLVVALALSVGPAGHRAQPTITSWLPQYDEDDWRHPDHVPPWFRGNDDRPPH